MHWLLNSILGLLVRLVCRVRTDGHDLVPDGAAVLVANHLSSIDRWLLTGSVGRRGVVFCKAQARHAVDKGHLFGIFPEGAVSPDGRLYLFRTEAIDPVRDTKAPIVPVGIQSGPRRLLARRPVWVTFGPPVTVDEYGAFDAAGLARFLMIRVLTLTHQVSAGEPASRRWYQS